MIILAWVISCLCDWTMLCEQLTIFSHGNVVMGEMFMDCSSNIVDPQTSDKQLSGNPHSENTSSPNNTFLDEENKSR